MQSTNASLNSKSSTSKRNGEVDFLKFLFAVMIVFYHTFHFATHGENIFPGGFISVEFFFIVSGYLMAQSAAKVSQKENLSVGPETMHFMWKKIKGMIPEFYVAWIIGFIVECYIRDASAVQVSKDALYSVFELLFLTQSGLSIFRANTVAWFVSAMLLAMLLLFPILIKRRTLFLTYLAPVISIFLLGWMYQTYDTTLNYPTEWFVFAYRGLVRAVAELALGCVCFTICSELRKLDVTRFFSILLTLVEILCFGFVIGWSYFHGYSDITFCMIPIIAIGVIIAFSQKNMINEFFNKPIFSWLGGFSFSMFLAHGYWSHAMTKMFPGMTYWEILPRYLLIALATALFIKFTSVLIMKKWPVISGKIRDLTTTSK